MDEVTHQFQKLIVKYKENGQLTKDEIRHQLLQHLSLRVLKYDDNGKSETIKLDETIAVTKSWTKCVLLLALTVTVALISIISMPNFATETKERVMNFIQSQPCLVENNMIVREIARPLFNCDICENITEIDILENVTREEFARKYAFTKVPVLIRGATKNWTAPDVFSWEFFKQLYTEEAINETMQRCQFFPYVSDFTTLNDVFEMSPERAHFAAGEKPWYIGWSNCDIDIKKKLREHYSKPYFLPEDMEHSSLDWIFMGGPGNGAHVHLDHVRMPSWQAQLSGKKTWSLIPVPECDVICHTLNVTLNKGDIFLVDTNTWYHSTLIHPGDISITIGSEYY